MRAPALIAIIVVLALPIASEANPGTFARLPLQHPVANWFPVDIHSDGQWELAILTAESPQRVGVYDARQRRWIEGPRPLPVTGTQWGVGDWNNDGYLEYAYRVGNGLRYYDPGHSRDTLLWTYTKPAVDFIIWGRGRSEQPVVGWLIADGANCGTNCSQHFWRWNLIDLTTGERLDNGITGRASGVRWLIDGVQSDSGRLLLYEAQDYRDQTPHTGRQIYFQSVRLVDSHWSTVDDISLPTWYSGPGSNPSMELWSLHQATLGRAGPNSPNLLAWYSSCQGCDAPLALPDYFGADTIAGGSAWDACYACSYMNVPYAGMAVYDVDGDGTNELLLPLRSGFGWERRILSSGALIDTVPGLPAVNLQVGSIVHRNQDALFYLADSSLYLFVRDVNTGILDGPGDGIAGDASTADFTLSAYPNPFNAAVTLFWSAGVDAQSLKIYNILGQEVRSYTLTEGNGDVTWDGRDTQGRDVASGVYFGRLVGRDAATTVKLVLLR